MIIASANERLRYLNLFKEWTTEVKRIIIGVRGHYAKENVWS